MRITVSIKPQEMKTAGDEYTVSPLMGLSKLTPNEEERQNTKPSSCCMVNGGRYVTSVKSDKDIYNAF